MWHMNYFCCFWNNPHISLMTYSSSNAFFFNIFLYFIFLNVYLLFIIVGMCKFEHLVKSAMDLLANGSCNLFRLINKINGWLRILQ